MRYPSSWAITGDIMNRICKTCGEEFVINKWQKGKIYCTEACKPKWQKPPTGRPVGRPKKTDEVQRNI